jgi:hypothetical protein
MPRACKLGLEGIVSKRLGVAALGQEQESGGTGCETGRPRKIGEEKHRGMDGCERRHYKVD